MGDGHWRRGTRREGRKGRAEAGREERWKRKRWRDSMAVRMGRRRRRYTKEDEAS